jgi:RsiW-degrading membrane proteinase PrsW (M82 family)
MLLDIAISAGTTLPLYLGALLVLTKEYDKKFSKLLRLFFLSTLSTAPLFALKYLQVDSSVFQAMFGPLAAILVLAFVEELLKSLFLFFDKEFTLSYTYPIVIGIGFAFLENVSYFVNLSFSASFVAVVIVRLFLDSTAHAVFTCTIVHFMRKGRRSMRTQYYLLGLLFSGTLHGVFNLLHHFEMNYMAIPLLAIIIYWLHTDSDRVEVSHAVRHQNLHRNIPI